MGRQKHPPLFGKAWSTLALAHCAPGSFSRKSGHPDLSTVRSLRKAARGPAERSGLDQRRQPISGKRDHVRASERSRDTGAVGTTVRFAGRLRFFLDAKVDPDGFQPKLGSHRATIAKVDICTPTPFRRCGTSWAPSASTLWHPQRPRSASLRVPMHRRFSHGTVEQAPLE